MKVCFHIVVLIIVLIQPVSCLFNSKSFGIKSSVFDNLSKTLEKALKNFKKQSKSAMATATETTTTTTTTAATTPTNSVAPSCVSTGCPKGKHCVVESTNKLCTNSTLTCSCTPGCTDNNQFIPMNHYVSINSCTVCTCANNEENVPFCKILCKKTIKENEIDKLGGVT